MAGRLVLVVDDDPLVARTLAEGLTEAGYDARVVPARDDALEAATGDEHPDGLVAGVHTGGFDGAALLARLRAGDRQLVGLLMTEPRDDEATARAIAEVGSLARVDKPPQLADVLPRLAYQFERRDLARALAEKERALAASKRSVARAEARLEETHTELETATERLVQSEQLAAVGRVVTGIAHELARQLTLVGYAEAIKSRVAEDPELVECAEVIIRAQKRLAGMVDEIRDFVVEHGDDASRAPALDREPADVAAVVEEALALMAYDRDVRERTIARRVSSHPLARLHRQKFIQVVINLVSNAVLATEPGDEIEVCVDAEDGHAVVTVRDQGTGMDADVLARLGEPFFTTRGDSGSGLGVGICMRIVEDHGGALTFQSKLGAGTAARVTVPLLEDV